MLVNLRVAIPGPFSAIFISCQHAQRHTQRRHIFLFKLFFLLILQLLMFKQMLFFKFSVMRWIQGVKYLSRQGVLNLNDYHISLSLSLHGY